MKVILFWGGIGMRLPDYSGQIPKPLVDVGQRAALWHLMKYYSQFGHNEFVLCLDMAPA
jgi:glucose-1-phosphate cytidylyltransferase